MEETYTYRYLNGVFLKDGNDALLVNWCELTVTRADGKVTYKNAFATNHPLSNGNMAAIVLAGRTRWKLENENNNTLNDVGLQPGTQLWAREAASFLTASDLDHPVSAVPHVGRVARLEVQAVAIALAHAQDLLDALQALTEYIYCDSWEHLLTSVLAGLELDIPPNTSRVAILRIAGLL